MSKKVPKIGECHLICGRPFMVLPCIDDGKPRCYHCSVAGFALPSRAKKGTGGKYAIDDKQLYVHCRGRKIFQCDRPTMRGRVLIRTAYPLPDEDVRAYCEDVDRENERRHNEQS